MTRRRNFLVGLGAAGALPSAAIGQETEERALPNCFQTRDLANGWQWLGTIRNRKAIVEEGADPNLNWSIRPESMDLQVEGFESLGYPDASSSATVRVEGDSLETLAMRISVPRPQTEGGERLGKDFLVGRTATLDFFLDGSTERLAHMDNISDFQNIRVDPIPDWLLPQLREAQSMSLRLRIDQIGFTAFRVSISGLEDAYEEGRGAAADYLASVQSAAGCRSSGGAPCMMTTAAVDMLGRSDHCFELTQMRRLREAFSSEASVIEAYLRASNEILQAPERIGAKIRLGLFYALVVWPTAVLVWAGALHAARRTYLTGFQLLFGRLT